MEKTNNDLEILSEIITELPLSPDEKIILESLLDGGVISSVGKGIYSKNGEETPVAIKYTKREIKINEKFSPLEARNILKYAHSTHDLDVQLLNAFQKHKSIRVPTVLKSFENERVTVMTNFNSQGFTLFQDLLVKGTDLNLKIFQNVGNVLADLRIEMSSLSKELSGVEDRILQIEERTDELRISLYDNRMHYYNEIWHNLLDDQTAEFTWTDGHPKNIAVNEAGEIMVFDFGRSIKCDPEYPLANFLGQILLFMMTGSIDFQTGEEYFHETIDAYTTRLRENSAHSNYNLNEKNFVWYLMAEFAHRGKTMRWIDEKIIKIPGDDNITRVKLAVDHLIDLVFDKTKPITTTNELLLKGKSIAQCLTEDPTAYVRPRF